MNLNLNLFSLRKFFYLILLAALLISLFILLPTLYASKDTISKTDQENAERIAAIRRKSSVLIVFSVAPEKCSNPIGEEIYNQSYLNKRRYSTLKNYDLVFNRRQVRSDVSGSYNKFAIMSEILENETQIDDSQPWRRHEWLFWMDYDVLISDMSLDIPFENYKDVNFVVWGSSRRFSRRADGKSINSGVFLLRNNEWSRRFLDMILTFGVNDGRAHEDDMKRVIQNYDHDLYEQNAIIYLGKKYPELRSKFYFESSLTFNKYWFHSYPNRESNPLIVHFAGCFYCTKLNDDCNDSWNHYFKISNESFYKEAMRKNPDFLRIDLSGY